MNRVVITGQGTINPLGLNVHDTYNAFAMGRCGIDRLDIVDVDRLSIKIGAQVSSYNPLDFFTKQELSLYDRFTQFALIAGKEAIEGSGISFEESPMERAGVILGTAGGGLNTHDENYRLVYEGGKNRVHPFVVPRLMHNAAVSHLSMRYGFLGPCYTVSTACASANHAMGQAFQMIQSGATDIMLSGGSEAMLCFGGIKAWEGLRVMSPDGCRPFCRTRNGMVQGEGAGVFVFENYDHAKKRGADILAEVIGFSMNSDAHEIVMPSQNGAARAIGNALKYSGISPDHVGYINAHGTATQANDKSEAAAIHSVFGAKASDVFVSSTKSMHGHLIGATGAVELLSCIMALRDDIIAPSINYTLPDANCDLKIIGNTAGHEKVNYAMSNAFAFGGLNAVIVLAKV